MNAPVAASTSPPVQEEGARNSSSVDLQAILGPPALFDGEDENAYQELLARVQASVRPKDIIEEIWVRDVVDLTWDVLRLRRLKANIMVAATQRAIKKVLAPAIGLETAGKVSADWAARTPGSVDEFNEILTDMELSMDVVMAEALRMRLDDVESIDRLIVSAEARRNAVLREVDRHRVALADALRRASENVRDAVFTEVARDGSSA